MPGSSLVPTWSGDGSPSDALTPILCGIRKGIKTASYIPINKGGLDSLILDRYQYIRHRTDGHGELYDFGNGTSEEHDLSGTGEGRHVIERLRSALESLLAQN